MGIHTKLVFTTIFARNLNWDFTFHFGSATFTLPNYSITYITFLDNDRQLNKCYAVWHCNGWNSIILNLFDLFVIVTFWFFRFFFFDFHIKKIKKVCTLFLWLKLTDIHKHEHTYTIWSTNTNKYNQLVVYTLNRVFKSYKYFITQ